MYAAYFGLKESPFKLSPEPAYLYLSRQHRDALNYLIYGIQEKKGFVLISGEIGMGKTTVCRTLMNHLLEDSVETALIFNTAVSEMELLETIASEFGIYTGQSTASKKTYIDALNRFLLKTYVHGKYAVLLIDEAQNLTHAVLEQIRMLSNLETDGEKLLQTVLIGQPELRTMLALPALRQLNERITVRCHLSPLDQDDVTGYIDHRLRVAGGPGRIRFTQKAYDQIYHFSEGIPRRINALCDRILLIAYTKGMYVINHRLVRNAAEDIGNDYFQKNTSGIKRLWHRMTG
jgi:general secretion pathway protein A